MKLYMKLTILIVVTLIIVAIEVFSLSLQPGFAVSYTVNQNPEFNNQTYWGEMVNQWNGQTSNYHGDAWVSVGIAHTHISCYGGPFWNSCWANCWLGQGETLWIGFNGGGAPITPVPCTEQQWLVGRGKLEFHSANWNGLTATYINLWGNFSQPTGTKGYDKFEIVVYLTRSRAWDFWGGHLATLTIDNEGAYNRYVVQYRVPSNMDIGAGWRDYHVDVSALFNAIQNSFNVNLALGQTTGLNVGNEASNARSQSAHDYVYYYVG